MSYVTRLRIAARYCEYPDTDDMICSAVLSRGNSEWLTTRAFTEKEEPTLTSILALMTTKAISTTRSKAMHAGIDYNEDMVNHVANDRAKSNA